MRISKSAETLRSFQDFDTRFSVKGGEHFTGKRFDRNTLIADPFELSIEEVDREGVAGRVFFELNKRPYPFSGKILGDELHFEVKGIVDAVHQEFVAHRRGDTLVIEYHGRAGNAFPVEGRIVLQEAHSIK